MLVMRKFILSFLLLPLALSAQRRVSDVCKEQKLSEDSAMRSFYGEYLFDHFFVFDTNSYVWSNGDMYRWNDTLHSDSISSYQLVYSFHFPGARMSYPYTYTYTWPVDKNGKLHVYQPALTTYGRGCSEIAVDSITAKAEQTLKVPMDSCNVTLYHTYVYPHRTQRHADTLVLSSMYPGHLYLTVSYCTAKQEITTKRSGSDNPKIDFCNYLLVFDACTGELVANTVQRYTLRSRDYYGID